MTNWDKCINELGNIGVGTFDVPNHFVKWLKDNISNKHKRNTNLAGHIKNEHGYEKWPDELEQFLINSGVNNKNLMNYTDSIKVLTKGLPFVLDSLWVNRQKKYEFNPPHNHEGVWSFIIFLQIPYKLEDENKVFPKTSHLTPQTSRLNFFFLNNFGEIFDWPVDVDKSFEGKMLMFSSKQMHEVYPFYTSDDYRITVSGNMKFKV